VVLDATFQPGYAGSPLIELDGSLAGSSADGLTITAGGSVVRALAIDSFAGNAIVLRGQGGDLIAGNYIGTDLAGTAARGNGAGVFLDNTSGNAVGGTAPGDGNLVSGNRGTGVGISGGSGNRVQGNLIGTDVTGHARLGNRYGLFLQGGSNDLIGGAEAGARNVISASTLAGIDIESGRGHRVQANYVGTDVTGNQPLGNGQDGVLVDFSSANVTVGGTAAGARNVVSANGQNGVYVTSGSGNVVQGNYLGTNAAGTAALANAGSGSVVGGTGNTVGGTAPGAGNLLSGNHDYGLFLSGAGHLVQGNLVGTDGTGTAAVPNGSGVGVNLSGGDTIGGTAPGAGNVISANTTYGLRLINTSGNRIQGNLIGTDLKGTRALGNGTYGLRIEAGLNNTVGGTTPEARNVISANGTGISVVAIGASVQGNYIGTDVTGTAALGNGVGVAIEEGSGNVVGGTDPGAGNLISGNQADGVSVQAGGTLLQGNRIGTDAGGARALGNIRGVLVGSSGNTIGGTAAGAGNLISGNRSNGLELSPAAGNNVVQGNVLGTDAGGTQALGNAGVGVAVSGPNNTIGGPGAGAGNLISANQANGVEVFSGSGNRILGNTIGTDVSGTAALGNFVGVLIDTSAGGNTVGGPGAGNLISGNRGSGVLLASRSNVVQGNFIGTDAAGGAALGNLLLGVSVQGGNNTIGGTDLGAGNLISGNRGDGILLGGGMALLLQNAIGTDVTGTRAVPNLGNGVSVASSGNTVGGAAAAAGNLISGNQADGIHVTGTGTVIQGNYIGTDVTGTRAVGNTNGVTVSATGATVGGTAAGNLISGNRFSGVLVQTAGAVIQGNAIGADVTGTRALANSMGVTVSGGGGTGALIGGTAAASRNLISGNVNFGVFLDGAARNTVQGNYIGTDVTGTVAVPNGAGVLAQSGATGNLIGGTALGAGNVIAAGGASVQLSSGATGNLIQGNNLGTDANGTRALGNLYGVYVSINSTDNVIGGTETGAGNLISGSLVAGIGLFNGSDRTRIQGNRIGTDGTGTVALANQTGVIIGTFNDVIGGTEAGAGNLISGNTEAGLNVSAGFTLVQGNRVGTDAGGTRALPNGGIGILVRTYDNTIGGTAPGAGNLISGNTGAGVQINDSSSNIAVQGNFIGTDVTGTRALGNGTGVEIAFGPNNLIGGTTAAARNVISGNRGAGVLVTTSGNQVQGNSIGTDSTGTLALGNGGTGVALTGGANNNAVGGTAPGAANTIACNGGDGVLVDVGTGNAILRNAIFANRGLGIELLHDGNNNQPAPVLTSASSGGGVLTVQGTFTGRPSTTYTLEFFANGDPSSPGQGERFFAALTVTTDAGGHATFTLGLVIHVAPGESLTATATDPANNTSAFSQPVEVTGSSNVLPGNQGGGIRSDGGFGIVPRGSLSGEADTVTSTGGDAVLCDVVSANAGLRIERLHNGPNGRLDPSGPGQGERFFAAVTVTTDADGNASFMLSLAIDVAPGEFLTATATDPANNTSAFSQPVAVTG
jgi:hypothetical protein